MCLVQGGGGFHVLSNSVYEYITGRDVADIIVDPEEVSDVEAKHMIDEVARLSFLLFFFLTFRFHYISS